MQLDREVEAEDGATIPTRAVVAGCYEAGPPLRWLVDSRLSSLIPNCLYSGRHGIVTEVGFLRNRPEPG